MWEKRKNENAGESTGHIQSEKSERSSKDAKKEENVKKDRLRNKVHCFAQYIIACMSTCTCYK